VREPDLSTSIGPVATDFDQNLLQTLLRQGALDQAGAQQCLQRIEGEAQRGRRVAALEVLKSLSLVEPVALDQAIGTLWSALEDAPVAPEPPTAPLAAAAAGAAFESTAPAPAPGYASLAHCSVGFEDFDLGPKLSRDAVGTSYAGRRRSDGAEVEIKTISREFHQFPDQLGQVLNDVRAWQAVASPNLATPIAVGSIKDRHGIAFQRVEAPTIAETLRRQGTLEPAAAAQVVSQVALALAEQHARGLAAGDVRAEEIRLAPWGAVLTHVGLARASCLGAGYGQHGIRFGHPAYLAPEVLQEGHAAPTPAADVYALGVLLYLLICGRFPFQGSVREVLRAHLEAPLPPPPPCRSGVTVALAGLMIRMTAKDPRTRLEDGLSAGRALRALAGQGPLVVPRTDLAPDITLDEWSAASAKDDHAGYEGYAWSTDRIEQARSVGPVDLDADPLDGSVRIRSGRLDAQPVERGPAAPPTRRVEVGEVLGRGGVGTSYAGALDGEPVVVKVVSKRIASHAELLGRLVARVREAGRVEHPRVVRPLDVLEQDGRTLIAYEALEGNSLSELIAFRGHLPAHDAVDRLREVARALEAAAAAGVSHGDVRPAKVLLTETGLPCVIDFGFAEAACLAAGFGKYGLPFGHPEYQAPEVVQERLPAPTPATDMYSLGVLAYELLVGRPPFRGASPKETLVEHLTKPLPPPPAEVSIPAPLASLILQMTSKDPSRRPGSFTDLIEELDNCLLQDSAVADTSDSSPSLAVDEFDPTMTLCSEDVWGDMSKAASGSGSSDEWTVQKLEQVEKVGPKASSSSSLGESSGELMGYIAAAAQAREGGGGGAAAATKKKGPRAGAGSRRATARPAKVKDEQVDRSGLVKVGLGLAVALGLMVAAASLDGGGGGGGGDGDGGATRPPPSPSDTTASAGPGDEPTPGDAADDGLDPAFVERRLDAMDERIAAALGRDDFAGARAVPDDLDPAVAATDAARARIRAAAETIDAAVAARMEEVAAEVDRLLDVDELLPVEQRLARIADWAGEDPTYDRLSGELERKRAARRHEVAALPALPGLDPAAAARPLGALSLDRDVDVLPNGGVTLRWSDPRRLAADLERVVAPAAADAEPTVTSRGIAVSPSPDPLVYAVRGLWLQRPVEVRLTVALTADPAPEAQIAVLTGVRPPRPQARGILWGVVPVRSIRGWELREDNSQELPPLAADQELRLTLRCAPSSLRGRLEVTGSLLDRAALTEFEGARTFVPEADLRGTVGIYLRGVEGWITGLEVRGLLAAE